ncbi:MAG TPA: hypothetical protein VE967_09195 [Gemmatimonadaceae bacterium]|nr:hypothetical protein [Gemmatimonadaceae bacterium]
MTDPAAITQALSAIKSAAEIVKVIRSADAGMEKAELKLKIAELAESLADARLAVVDAQEQIITLQRQLTEAARLAEVHERVERRNSVYYLRDADSESGPYCPRCYEVDRKLVSLRPPPRPMRHLGQWQCPNCDKLF